MEEVKTEIRSFLWGNEELLKNEFQNGAHPLAGHCYVATEAMYHVLGADESDYTPCQMKHEGVSHWFLRHSDGSVIDLTSEQFDTTPPYEEGRGRGFQKTPSNRCRKVLEHLESEGFSILD